eukprot:2928475-Pyramimonas_sp.AAC.1
MTRALLQPPPIVLACGPGLPWQAHLAAAQQRAERGAQRPALAQARHGSPAHAYWEFAMAAKH